MTIPAPGEFGLFEIKDRTGRTWTAIAKVLNRSEHFGRVDLVVCDPFGDSKRQYKTTARKLKGWVDKQHVAAILSELRSKDHDSSTHSGSSDDWSEEEQG